MDLGADLVEMENRLMASNSINCPHCQLQGFHIAYVGTDDVVRDYSYIVPQLSVGNELEHDLMQPSPVKIGESFEGLKRKMVKYRNSNSGTVVSLLAAESNQSRTEGMGPITGRTEYDRINSSDRLIALNASTPRIDAVVVDDARFENIRDDMIIRTAVSMADETAYGGVGINDIDDALLSPSIYSTVSDMLSPLNSSYQTSLPQSPTVINLSSTMVGNNFIVSSNNSNLESYHNGHGVNHLYASLVVQQLLTAAVEAGSSDPSN